MNEYTKVSRKTVGEDRVAICPNFGCEYMKRVKTLKFRFIGFGKYPKCKKHHIPLVYVDERIGDFVDTVLACLFDLSGLPPYELISEIRLRYPDEITIFLDGWVYSITTGRGAPIISQYMDTISKVYLKQLTKKQIKTMENKGNSKINNINGVIKDGIDEITFQYTRILKHLRIHSEIFFNPQKLKFLSNSLRNYLEDWQNSVIKQNKTISLSNYSLQMSMKEIKNRYDQILNVGTCRCLIGLDPEDKEIKKLGVGSFDRYSVYHEFSLNHLTQKFTKSDISALYSEINLTKGSENLSKKHSASMNGDEISDIKKKLKMINWSEVSSDWKLRFRKNQYSEYKTIELNPYKECTECNPLYKHKDWIDRVYNDENFDMSDEKLAKLCNVTKRTIFYWRKIRYGIKGKEEYGKGRWVDSRSGRIYIRTSDNYNHPQLKIESNRSKVYRPEHIIVMERYLATHPNLEISRKYLIQGKYLKTECEIHHINFSPKDNRIENLWIYESKKAHAQGEKSIRIVFYKLITIGGIIFKDGFYHINKEFNLNSLSDTGLNKVKNCKPKSLKNMNLAYIKGEIKKINWKDISNDWRVIKHFNQFRSKIIELNPYIDCDKSNPLYMHKVWFIRIYNDPVFKLTDSKIGKICGISKDTVRYWREKVHNIKGKKEWGQKFIVDKSDGRIWVRVPKQYANPVVDKEGYHRRLMIEHRYVMECFLAQHPDWNISQKYLNDGKYLKSECEVHHINLDCQDNRISNLWVFENNVDHQKARESLYNLVQDLLNSKIVIFKNGKYLINY